jgi:hypothetical protein
MIELSEMDWHPGNQDIDDRKTQGSWNLNALARLPRLAELTETCHQASIFVT